MNLVLKFGRAFCHTPEFVVNGVDADYEDFGSKFDRSPETAEAYSCGDMQFNRNPPTAEVLSKYKITIDEYHEIAEQLEKGLSFGNCGWCS